MTEPDEKRVRLIAGLVHLSLFMGLGMVASCWFVASAVPGAFVGLALYLFIILFVMILDIMAINRELSAFRNGEDDD